MIETIITQLTASFNNQFLSGGLVLMLMGSIAYYLRRVPTILWDLFLRYFTVVLDVQSSDRGYDWLLTWLSKQEYGRKSRRVSIKNIRSSQGIFQTVMIPAKGQHWFFYNKRPLWITRSKDAEGPATGSDISEIIAPREIISVRTIGRSRDALNAIVEAAKADFEAIDKDLTLVNRYTSWGTWRTDRKPKRPMESIMFPPDAKDLILDLEKFIASKDWYRQMGIPYKRGYLFYGPPGTGKSSTVEAIAGYLNLPIYLLNLATCTDDKLEQAIGGLDNDGPSILLLEDIDTVKIKRDAETDKQKISLGTLLNVLDGVQSADSVILILTSNRPDTLDNALTRHGRVDRWIEFGMATEEQIKTAIHRFLGNPTLEQCQEIGKWPRPISMAEVQERLKILALG